MKLALVIQGGGMRGAYAAGVLDVLMENEIWADAVYGTSAGALSGLNYVSRDKGRAAKVFLTQMTDGSFVKPINLFLKGSAIDFTEILPKDSKDKLPFDSATFFSSATEFYCCATDCESGTPVYFSKLDPDFWHGVAASASLPLATQPTLVHGHPYLDGGVVDPVPLVKAFEDGATKVIVILTRSKGYRKEPLSPLRKTLAKALYRKYPVFLQAYYRSVTSYNDEMDFVDRLGEEGKVFVIYPSVSPKLGHREKDPLKIQELIDEGTVDALACLPKLKEYLSK